MPVNPVPEGAPKTYFFYRRGASLSSNTKDPLQHLLASMVEFVTGSFLIL